MKPNVNAESTLIDHSCLGEADPLHVSATYVPAEDLTDPVDILRDSICSAVELAIDAMLDNDRAHCEGQVTFEGGTIVKFVLDVSVEDPDQTS